MARNTGGPVRPLQARPIRCREKTEHPIHLWRNVFPETYCPGRRATFPRRLLRVLQALRSR